MSGTNDIIHSAISDFKNEIENTVEQGCRVYCGKMLDIAIRARLGDPKAHNFTGNLLNSIVVCLYKKGKPIVAYYASGMLHNEPIHAKMTFRNRRRYRFKPDYDGVNSSYLPKVKTNEGWGQEDARSFFESYRPQGSNLFDIVVAYPVEYADWVELQRHTTGYLQTLQNAERVGITFLKI